MGRKNKLWYRKDRKVWMVTINGKRHNLGPDKKEAEEEFYRLMAAKDPNTSEEDLVEDVICDFILWCKEHRAKKTTERYKEILETFTDKYPDVTVGKMTPAYVTRWMQDATTWNATTKRNAMTAVIRVFNWAVKNRGLRFNPIAGMEKPKAKRRTKVVSDQDFKWLLENVSPAFRDLMIVSWDCGCRPQETKRLEAKQIDFERQLALIKVEEGAKGGKTRLFYIPTERALEVVKRLSEENPEGPIFRNRLGNAWTKDAVKCQFQRIREKHGRDFTHYAMRHTNITKKLMAGVDSHVVAKLAGHSSTRMIDEVYSHVAQDHDYMLRQAKRGA
ncbi:phage integrase family protein [Rhodopirellula maiorica SM1]|uniref:Phage integrase family protein n=1 Tax=Rhodopirellula maiorica SM1 TaxID=1265738 RepID=M5RVY7_9BACT|nr:site-specific integrase [Rhodopirellula maiorica]EMI19562.1 phage integrase family protein [Rhodopirellula maiorica SM1]